MFSMTVEQRESFHLSKHIEKAYGAQLVIKANTLEKMLLVARNIHQHLNINVYYLAEINIPLKFVPS